MRIDPLEPQRSSSGGIRNDGEGETFGREHHPRRIGNLSSLPNSHAAAGRMDVLSPRLPGPRENRKKPTSAGGKSLERENDGKTKNETGINRS